MRYLILLLLPFAAFGQTRFEDEVIALERLPVIQNAVTVTGNSNIRLWTTMKADLAPTPVNPRGFGGSTAKELDYYLQRLVLSTNPRAVVICEGENEVWSGTDGKTLAATMSRIVQRIDGYNGAKVYVVGLKPSPKRWSKWPQFSAANTELKRLCSTGRCTFIDVGPRFMTSSGPIAKYFLGDQLHFNAAGYAVFSAQLRDALAGRQPIDDIGGVRPNPPTAVNAR